MALTKCGECGREVSDKAVACPGCGAPINPAEPTPTVTAVALPEKKTGCGTITLAVIGGLLVLGWIVSLFETKKPAAMADDSGNAAYACQRFVIARLRAPSTADFPWRYESTREAGDQYTIVSYVDAQNAFGAQIRTHYVCTVKLSNNNWNLVDLTTSP